MTSIATEVSAADLIATPAPAPQPSVPQPPEDGPSAEDYAAAEKITGHAPFGSGNVGVVAPNPFAGQLDSLKREFHPAKFRLKDGKPQIDSTGRFVPLGLGKPRASSTAESGAAGSAPRSFIPPDETAPAPSGAVPIDQMAAEVAINLVQTALILIGQDEGILTDFERTTLRGPLSRILAKYNLGDKMTPELEFAAALAVIVMTRLQKPKTMGWVQGKILAVRNWMTRRKLGNALKPTPEAQRNPAPGPEAAQEYLDRHK